MADCKHLSQGRQWVGFPCRQGQTGNHVQTLIHVLSRTQHPTIKARCAHDIRRTKMDPVRVGDGDQGLKTRANNGSLNIPHSWSETISRPNYMYTDMYNGLVFYLQTSWPKLCVRYHYCALYHMYNCTCIECVGWSECVKVYMLRVGCVGVHVWVCVLAIERMCLLLLLGVKVGRMLLLWW